MKQKIAAFDYAKEILTALPQGILITTQVGETVNPMTIGWGTMGIEWGKPIFIAYVRESRYTRELLDQSLCFTVNVPVGECDKEILRLCGTKSGRDMDKVAALNLHLEPGETVQAPGIRELPLTLECRVIYRQLQDKNALPPQVMHYYPEPDIHVAYYGEILNAYLIAD